MGAVPTRTYKMSPTAERFHNSTAKNKGAMGCLPCWTEVMTPGGWIRIDEWDGQEILQWNPDSGRATFIRPKAYVKKPCPEGMLRFDGGNHFAMTVTPDHRVPCYDWTGTFRVKTAERLAKKPSKHRMPTTWESANLPEFEMTDDELRLWVAVCADGSYPKSGNQCLFTFHRQRKIERMRELLGRMHVGWTETTKWRKDKGAFETRFTIERPKFPKHFDWRLSTASSEQAAVMVDELKYWDGLFDSGYDRYDTTIRQDADIVQFLAHSCGRNATLRIEPRRNENHAPLIRVHIAKPGSRKNRVSIRCDEVEIERVEAPDGMQYCFQTQMGFFVVRQEDHVFVTGNCVGNGKTVFVMHDLLFRSEGQVPDPRDGVRRSRWFVIRNTYQQLMNSTVKSWLEWFPDTVMKYSPHPVGLLRRPSMRNDGTTVEIELMFFALDKAEQERDLLGVEATGAWINEAREISEDHMAAVQSRIGRYPATREDYKPLSLGMLMDTNPPDDQSWWYRLAEVEKPVGWEFFKCPPALLRIEDKKTGKVRYEPNRGQDPAIPAAENIEHLSEGFNYYLKQVAVWPDAKVRVMVCGEYGTILTGVPVYPQWNDEANLMERELEPMWGLPIFVGTDGGFTPSAVAGQVLPNGQIAVYDELVAENISCGEFAERFLKPWLINSFRLAEGQRLMCFHDPSGLGAGKTSDGVTEIVAMQQKGIPVMPCPVMENAVGLRLECVREAMRRRVDGGKGGLVVSRKCKTLLAGLRGRYQYRRLNTSSAEKRYADSPDKGPLSHVQDALQYMVYGALHPDGSPQGRDPFSTKPPDARLWLPQSARGETGTQQALATGLDLAGYF